MTQTPRTERPARRRLAGSPSSAIYGTIVAGGLLAVEGATDDAIATILVTMFGTLVVFWLAHAYAHLLASGIVEQKSDFAEVRSTLRTEWPIVESGVVPGLTLGLAAAFGASRNSAILAALVLAVAELCLWASLACRRMDLGWQRSLVYVVVSALLGVAVIALKVVVH